MVIIIDNIIDSDKNLQNTTVFFQYKSCFNYLIINEHKVILKILLWRVSNVSSKKTHHKLCISISINGWDCWNKYFY